jgi:hypothetical protein
VIVQPHLIHWLIQEFVDGVCTILSKSTSTGIQTRHVDTRYHVIREFGEDWFLKIKFVFSTEKYFDVFTKDVGQDIYEIHTLKILGNTSVEDTGSLLQARKGVGNFPYHYPL